MSALSDLPDADNVQPQSDFAAQLRQRFALNLSALRKHQPQLHARFSNYTPTRSMQFVPTPTGEINVCFTDSGELYYKNNSPLTQSAALIEEALSLTPASLPQVEEDVDYFGQIQCRYVNEGIALLKKFPARQILLRQMGTLPSLVVIGVGLGYGVGALYERVEVASLTLIEPDPDQFYASLYCFDWASLLDFLAEQQCLLQILLGSDIEAHLAALSEHYESQGAVLGSCRNVIIHDLRPEYVNFMLEFKRRYHSVYAPHGFFDDILFGFCHGLQALRANRHFVRRNARVPRSWRSAPVFIIGNGPSLDQDLDFIRAHQDQAVIIACGTALDTLYHAGVQPDFYACTERVPQIAETLASIPDQEFIGQIMLLGSEVVHPDTAAYFKLEALFVKSGEALCCTPIGERVEDIAFMNPLVGNLGLAAALRLGFDNLLLFGLDCGRKANFTQIHPNSSTLYRDNGVDISDNVTYELDGEVPANFGGVCHSGEYYRMGLETMRSVLKVWGEGVRCRNCSDGALIEGAEPVRSAMLDLQQSPTLDKSALKKLVAGELTFEAAKQVKGLEPLLERDAFAQTLTQLRRLWQGRPATRLEYLQRMAAGCLVMHKLAHSELSLVAVLLRGSQEFFFALMIRALYAADSEEECLKYASALAGLLDHFFTDAQRIYALAPDYVMGEHQRLLQGRVGFDHADSKAPPMPPLKDLVPADYQDPLKKFVKRSS
ncbi:MAG: DUF115 domain-containing protein [Succinivibrio sp.]|nr:DUF115 domain-containing protein [Succinivibrio sp.]